MHPKDSIWISSHMEIGDTVECDIGSSTEKLNLTTELSLVGPSQVEILAEEAGCYLYQGGPEVMDVGWSWPTIKYRLLANERTIRNIKDANTACFAVLQTGVSTGKCVFTETRKR